MKKIIAITLMMVMLFSFTSCSEGGNIEDSSTGGVVSGIKSDIESKMSQIGSNINSMMDSTSK